MVVFDAVLALVQQPPLLGDEVPDGPGRKLLVEGVIHAVHQHLNVWVNPHLPDKASRVPLLRCFKKKLFSKSVISNL